MRKVVTPKDDEAPWLLINFAVQLPHESHVKHTLMAMAEAWHELPAPWKHELRKALHKIYG